MLYRSGLTAKGDRHQILVLGCRKGRYHSDFEVKDKTHIFLVKTNPDLLH